MEHTKKQRLWSSKIRPGRWFSGSHWLYKSLDAVLTAPLKPRERKKNLVRSVVLKKTSNYNRVSALLHLVDSFLPGAAEKVARSLLRMDSFPVHGYQVRLFAYGSGATVYLLENDRDNKVLKVFRRSLGKKAGDAFRVVKEYKEKHHQLCSWFNQTYQIVVPSEYLLLQGPLLGVTAAALVQPHIEGKIYDLFQDFTLDEVVQLGQKDSRFRNQLLDFSRRLFAVIEEKGLCFDLVGRENLMLVEMQDGIQLKIVDNGIFDMQAIFDQSPDLHRRIINYLEQLRSMQQRLEENNEMKGGSHVSVNDLPFRIASSHTG